MIKYDKLTEKTFKFKSNVLLSQGGGLDISSFLKRVYINNDYTKNVMPVYHMYYLLPLDIVMLIQKDRDLVVFDLEILKSVVHGEINSSSDEIDPRVNTDKVADVSNRTFERYMKKVILKPLKMDDLVYDPSSLNRLDTTDAEEVDNIRTNGKFVKVEILAVPEKSLEANKHVTSGVFRNCSITEAILGITARMGKKIFLSKPDNTNKYNQVILYPGNVFSNLYHFQNTYGIYSDTLKLYTMEDSIIISSTSSNDILDNKSQVNINIEFDRTKHYGFTLRGMYEEKEEFSNKTIKTIVTNYRAVSIKNNAGVAAEVFGNDFTFTSRNLQGLNEQDISKDFKTRHGVFHKSRLYEDVFNNEYTREAFMKKALTDTTISIVYNNIDMDVNDGLRAFMLNFNDETYNNYSGLYKCTSLTHDFIETNSGIVAGSGMISLRKVRES